MEIIRHIGLVLSGIYSVFLIVSALDWRKLSRVKRFSYILGGVGGLITFAFLITDQFKNNIKERVSTVVGSLESSYTDSSYSAMMIRGSTVGEIRGVDGKLELLFGESQLKVIIKDNKPTCDVLVRDIDGSEIALLQSNIWKVYKNGYEYNNDDKGFEIVTVDRRVVFQAEFKNNILFIAGLIVDKTGFGCYLFPEYKDGEIVGVLKFVRPGEEFTIPADKIQPMFKYPREKFISQRAEVAN